MFWLIKLVFFVLLSFSGSLATNFMSLSNEPRMIRSTLIDLNPAELKYYPFMVSLDKCNGSCNAADNVSAEVCVPSQMEGIKVKVFNMIIRINEAKRLIKHVLCECKCKFNCKIWNLNKKWNNDTCQCECKKYCACKKKL